MKTGYQLPGASRETQRPRFDLRNRIKNRIHKFGKDESGAMIALAMISFIGMLAGAGMAVDFVRFEMTRAKMQSTLDRSLLAAAALNQSLDPEDVVRDYFAKSGLSDFTLTVDVDEGINFKTVTASVSSDVDSMFLNMVGIESMSAVADSIAEEKIQYVEVALVLDISGSMGSYSRLTNMKAAAKEFVETLLGSSDPGRVSISIIPYNANVNVGSRLVQEYNVTKDQTDSNCVLFDDEDFETTVLGTSQSLDRLAHFDPITTSGTSPISYPWCQTSDDLGILAWSISESALDARIDSLVAGGNTASDTGMKWAATFLDPNTSSVITSMITSGDVDSGLSDRPASYDDRDTIKAIILLTDGTNTTQYDIQEDRKSGYSNVWIDSTASSEETDKYSVYVAEDDEYYYPHDDTWNDEPLGQTTTTTTETQCEWKWKKKKGVYKWKCKDVDVETTTNAAVQLTYPELWATFSTTYVASYLYGWSTDSYNDYYNSYEATIDGDASDTRLLDICSASKDAGVVVFTVGFEAPTAGQEIMESCATSAAHYYDVDGLEVSEAFSAIAATLMRLKLIQ
jgi:Flp pilus assembly protein TadG